MADIINLRMARKARERAAGETLAQANRANYGRTKNERTATKNEAARIERIVDGALREREDN